MDGRFEAQQSLTDPQVIADVAAVVSAFHGGAEFLFHVRKKRSARKTCDSAQQEWDEERLQAFLVAAGQEIDQHYERDQRELGDLVRIGDGKTYPIRVLKHVRTAYQHT